MRALDFGAVKEFVYALLKLPSDTQHADRLLDARLFRGKVTAVTTNGGRYLVTLAKTGETAGSGPFVCSTPGYKPGVGDDVWCLWTSQKSAIVLWPANGFGNSSSTATGTGPITSLQAGPSGTPITGAVQLAAGNQILITESGQIITVAWNDPTNTIGDLLYRNPNNVIDRLAIGAVGTVLAVKNLGNFAAQLLNTNPYLWYRLSEAAGTTMADSSQLHAHPGTYNGSGVTYHVAPATGDSDYAVTFDGASGYAHVGADPTGSGDFSIALFVKGTSTSLGKIAAGTFAGNFSTPSPAYSWAFLPFGVQSGAGASGNTPSFYVSRTGAPAYTCLYAPGVNLHDGNWHFVVITRALTSGAVTMYIDGSPVTLAQETTAGAEGTGTTAYPGVALNGGADLYLGSSAGATDFFPGSEDEFALWQRVVSASEVATLWSNVAGPASAVEVWTTLSDLGLVQSNAFISEGDLIYLRNGVVTRLAVGGANTVLHGGTDPNYSAVVEADLSLSDNTTANATTSRHGLVPKLPNDATKYYDGTGAFSVPAGGGGGGGGSSSTPLTVTESHVGTTNSAVSTGGSATLASLSVTITGQPTPVDIFFTADVVPPGNAAGHIDILIDGSVLSPPGDVNWHSESTNSRMVVSAKATPTLSVGSHTIAIRGTNDPGSAGTVTYEMGEGLTVDVWSGGVLAGTGGDASWTPVGSFTNGWTNLDSTGVAHPVAAYRKDSLGFVELQGVIKSGTLGASAFTLPSGYRPEAATSGHDYITRGWDGAANTPGLVAVVSDGTVVIWGDGTHNSYNTLDGIRFYAGPPTGVALSLANEDQAGILINATSPGDAGGRSDHFTGLSLASAWTQEAAAATATAIGKSSFGIQATSAVNHYTQPYTPSGAFRVEMRVAILTVSSGVVDWGLMVRDSGSGDATGNAMAVLGGNLYSLDSGTWTLRAASPGGISDGQWVYVALARDGSNNWTAYLSRDRSFWSTIGTYTKAFTVAKLGLRTGVSSTLVSHDFIDVVS